MAMNPHGDKGDAYLEAHKPNSSSTPWHFHTKVYSYIPLLPQKTIIFISPKHPSFTPLFTPYPPLNRHLPTMGISVLTKKTLTTHVGNSQEIPNIPK